MDALNHWTFVPRSRAITFVRKRYARKNRRFRRRGEWFFVPNRRSWWMKLILRNEPLRRGAGKPPGGDLFRRAEPSSRAVIEWRHAGRVSSICIEIRTRLVGAGG
jgi:hypothetical protein